MRTWVKVTLACVAAAVLGFAVLAGTGAYFVFRHFDKRPGTEAGTLPDFEAVRSRFAPRPPLVEIGEPLSANIRVNRVPGTDPKPVETIHIMAWKAEDGELVRTEVPLWLMRFSSVNILSQLHVMPDRVRLTVDDVRRYGPGIVVDTVRPGVYRVLVWVD